MTVAAALTIPSDCTTGSSVATPVNVVFNSDWATATGTTDAALRDTNRPSLPGAGLSWDTQTFGANSPVLGDVIATTGLGFPQGMANCLRVSKLTVDNFGLCYVGTDASQSTTNFHWAQLPVGQAWAYRYYWRFDIPDSEPADGTNSNHPHQMGWNTASPGVTFDMGHHWWNYTDGTFQASFPLAIQSGVGAGPSFTNEAQPGAYIGGTVASGNNFGTRLPKQKVMRIETFIYRSGTTAFNEHIRIYDATNEHTGGAATLMYSEDGVGASNDSMYFQTGTPHTMASQNGLIDRTGSLNNTNGLDTLRVIGFGSNGGNHAYAATVHWYYGGVCVVQGTIASGTTWIGAYRGGI